VDTSHGILRRRAAGDDVVYEIAVTANAVVLRDDQVLGLDLNRLVKILKREAL
jgi:hypothetical protein